VKTFAATLWQHGKGTSSTNAACLPARQMVLDPCCSGS